MCLQYFPPKLEHAGSTPDGATVRISCGGSRKYMSQFDEYNLNSPDVYESDTCCPPLSSPDSYEVGCGRGDNRCDTNDNASGEDGCGCYRCFINGRPYYGWSEECNSHLRYASPIQPTAENHNSAGCESSCPSTFKGAMFTAKGLPGFIAGWTAPLAIQRADASACNRGFFGSSSQTSCSSGVGIPKCSWF